ncbi:unnamed protein product [Prorocentrum cordatum]|uniref:Uncharacterized protein n=1 Tax=Prorocentrum cordatum TaxID=2364126 RepID=A0ABN9V6C9_9DINO|nr:unnamed protein product [Polarella glacialis]
MFNMLARNQLPTHDSFRQSACRSASHGLIHVSLVSIRSGCPCKGGVRGQGGRRIGIDITDWVPSPGVLATPGPSPGEVQLPPGGGMRGGGAAPLASDAAAALPPPERRVLGLFPTTNARSGGSGKHAHQRGGRARPFGKRQGRGGDGAPPPVLRPLQAAAAARRRPRCYSARASALERDRVWEQLWSGVVATVSVSPPRRPPTGCLALPSFLA